mmetsp:Transcript_36890/g.77374  ORF Transcript_36890/g.77374 Transcript_36890/m.77374 type:complete len:374 (+) Transcript_36890:74-1195(+)
MDLNSKVDKLLEFTALALISHLFRLFVESHHSRKPLHQRRVRIMIRRIPRIGAHRTQILQVNLTQPTLQFLTHAQIRREFIRLELALARVHRHGVTQRLVDGFPHRAEEEEEGDDSGYGPGVVVESEGAVEFGGVVAEGEGVEGGAHVELADDKICNGVSHFPMTKLMSQNSQNLTIMNLRHQRIIQNNPLILEKSKHERIRMTAPLRPIHHKQLGQRKIQPARKRVNLVLQTTLGQLLVLVKQRHDHHGHQRHHDRRKNERERPHVQVEAIPPQLNDPEQQRRERSAEHHRQDQSLDLVRNEQPDRHLIEPVFLLDPKRRIQFPRQSRNRPDDGGVQQEYQTDFDFVFGFGVSKVFGTDVAGCIPDVWHESE